MGQPDQFAKETFAEETERLTGGAVTWQEAPESQMERVQCDGLLVVHRPERLTRLPAPWPEARASEELIVELKLGGDHVDMLAVEQALWRRQLRQAQRVEEHEPEWPGDEPLWLVAPYLPEWLEQVRTPVRISPGCYRVEPLGYCFMWIAADELPLMDELVPFLVARSGRPLDEFCRWVADRRPLEWVLNMIQHLAMSMPTREELRKKFAPSDDPEIEGRQQLMVSETYKKAFEKGRLLAARAALRQVLRGRGLELEPNDEARIEACDYIDTLARWIDQAVTASSVAEALR